MDISSKKKLNTGVEIPFIGFGTYQMKKQTAYQPTLDALKIGYRHIDTAQFYDNEAEVGQAIKDSGIPREEIFITSKLEIGNFGYENTVKSFKESVANIGSDYIDLFLLHWPVEKYRIESWKALEVMYKEGNALSIGVSNFTVAHLEELIAATEIVPAVNQVEFSPYLYQKELLEYCKEKEIVLEAYSPLTQANKLGDPKLMEIAKKYKKSTAQILVKWVIQHDAVVLPKSSNKDRIKENADVFDFKISDEDMTTLDGFNENLRYSWNPEDNKQVKTFSNSIIRKLSKLV